MGELDFRLAKRKLCTPLAVLILIFLFIPVWYICRTHPQQRPLRYASALPCDVDPVVVRQSDNQNKKVISLSLFSPPSQEDEADYPWFLDGALRNAEDARMYYPEWIVRIYVIGLGDKDEQRLLDVHNIEVVRCREDAIWGSSASRKMMSRFLAADDPSVQFSIYRDTDSRLNVRELLAVNDWISSGHHFHAMRDHGQHSVPMLGGMFGIKRGGLRFPISDLIRQALAENPAGITGTRGEDQSFLLRYLWPLARDDCISHDIDLARCENFGSISCKPFPTTSRNEDENFFVGAAFKRDVNRVGESLRYKCDAQCKVQRFKTA